MRTRSQARKRRQQQVRQTSVESPNLEKPNNNQETFNPPIVTMDDNRTWPIPPIAPWKRISHKGQKESKEQTKPSTGWKRQSQIVAKVSQSQKVNPEEVKSQPSEENTT
ncbi:hypothetical protein Tco_0248388 [Tanacetum coccineum]